MIRHIPDGDGHYKSFYGIGQMVGGWGCILTDVLLFDKDKWDIVFSESSSFRL